MTREEKAIEYFNNSFNCAQSVLTVFAPDFGISENDSLKIACGFGAGMGRQQHTCGAVTGALMALGLKFGMSKSNSEEKKKLTYEKTNEFFSEFRTLNGSANCKKLLDGLDMNHQDEMEKIKRLNYFKTRCEKYVSDAVKITEKLI